jgi:CRISPR-associated endonuclease Csn1
MNNTMEKTTEKTTNKILGLDIGANSIGWVLLEIPDENEQLGLLEEEYFKNGKILRCGVRIFPAGKEAFNSSKEKSAAEDRRIARGMRRRFRRVNERKKKVRVALIESGLLPQNIPNSLEFDTSDPLELRAKGVHEKLSLHEFGRVLYHLTQHRGFLSARKTPVKKKENATKNKDENTINTKTLEKNSQDTEKNEVKKEDILAAISKLENDIEQSGLQTLGEYLWSIRKESKDNKTRGYYTRRKMYQDEFEILWKKQTEFYPKLLTEELKNKIEQFIFYQRDIYWRQSTIGKCEFEKDEYRCFRADREAQEFRFYQEINNLNYVDSVTGNEIRVADNPNNLKKIYDIAKGKKSITFDKIREIIGLEGTDIRFNLEASKKKNKQGIDEEEKYRKELKAFETDAVLRKEDFFGKNWDKISDIEKNIIVRILIERPEHPDSEKLEFDTKGRSKQMSEEKMRKYIVEHWQKKYTLTDKQVDNLCDNEAVEKELPKGHLSLSRKALRKVLPFMRQGLLFSGKANKDGSYNDALHNAGYKRKDEEDWKQFDLLPQVHQIEGLQEINNPVVRRIVNETRLLVNAIMKQYGRLDKIHLELAREAKANYEERKKILKQNKENEKEREEARQYLKGEHINPTNEAILRYRLWKQQGKCCPYTKKFISVTQLFWGSEIDIDHILPYSRSFDDSQMNKVVCFAKANKEKGDLTPFEWLSKEDFEHLKERVQKYPKPKRDRLLKQTEIDKFEFMQRQLNDTKYASRYMIDYLRCLFTPQEWKAKRRILTVKGIQTANLRYYWGLNNILHHSDFLSDDLKEGEKNRGNHHHHAVDAIVIALTDTRQLKRLGVYKDSKKRSNFPRPWFSLREDAENAINKIIVSHRPSGRVRGSFHEDTNYGAVYQYDPNTDKKNQKAGEYVVRKKLTDLSASEIFDIRDTRIKNLVVERLEQFGLKTVKKNNSIKFEASDNEFKEKKKAAFAEPLYMEPECPHRTNDTKKRNPTEIKKVRIIKKNESLVPLYRDEQGQPKQGTTYVVPGNTHHICLFERLVQKKKGKTMIEQKERYLNFVTCFEANRRLAEQQRLIREKSKELQNKGIKGDKLRSQLQEYRNDVVKKYPVIRRFDSKHPEAKFLFTLKSGEMFKIKDKTEEKLVIFKTAAQTSGQCFFIDHRDARQELKKKDKEDEETIKHSDHHDAQRKPKSFSKTGKTLIDIVCKVCVDRLGNISENAND